MANEYIKSLEHLKSKLEELGMQYKNRQPVSVQDITVGIETMKAELYRRLAEKGFGSFASSHEILGVLTEEMNELESAVHNNNQEQIEKELMDIVIGAIFGAICIKTKKTDW
jgi:uncharacterized protein YabN with tetrapyrrole methylase and pyrophosphatase domain